MLRGALAVVFFLSSLQIIGLSARTLLRGEGICNTQGPFGFTTSALVLLVASAIAAFFFVWQWWREDNERQGLLWLLLLAAGGSNVLERLVYGCVFDFLTLPLFPFLTEPMSYFR